MELRPGFKLTDVGVIPSTWAERRLGEVATVGSGGTPSRDNPRFWNGAIPWITTSQIDFEEITEADEFITEEGLRSSAAKVLPRGTLLMALYGQGKTRGKVAALAIAAATNQACASIAVHPGISSEFLRYFLSLRYEAIRSASNGGSQDNLSGQIVKRLTVVVPPLPEQRAIAAALTDVDALLGALARLITKKRDLKQAAMQQLLTGQTRLPGFSGKWEKGTVGEVAAPIRNALVGGPFGSDLVADDYVDAGVPVIRGQNLGGHWVGGQFVFVTHSKAATLEANWARPGDVVFTQRGTVGQVSLVPIGGYAAYVVSQSQMKLTLNGNVADGLFVFYVFASERYQRALRSATIQTSTPHINLGILRRFVVPLPSLAEQQAIAAVLSEMDAELSALEARRDKTRLLKQGMMQELLTGRTRLV